MVSPGPAPILPRHSRASRGRQSKEEHYTCLLPQPQEQGVRSRRGLGLQLPRFLSKFQLPSPASRPSSKAASLSLWEGALWPLFHLCWFSATSYSCSPLPYSLSQHPYANPAPAFLTLPQDLCVRKSPGSLAFLANVHVNCWSKCSEEAAAQCIME